MGQALQALPGTDDSELYREKETSAVGITTLSGKNKIKIILDILPHF